MSRHGSFLSVDEAVTGKVEHHPGNILGLALTQEWSASSRAPAGASWVRRTGYYTPHRRVDHARADAIDADSVEAALERSRARQAETAPFAAA
jgi:hypothetical protein